MKFNLVSRCEALMTTLNTLLCTLKCVLHLSAGMKYDKMRSNKHWFIAEIKKEKQIKYNRLIQCNIYGTGTIIAILNTNIRCFCNVCVGNIQISSSISQSTLSVFNSPSIIVETVYMDLLSPRKGNKSRPSYNTK